MEYLVEGCDVLSKDELQKVNAGFVGCDEHCKLKIIICIIICYNDDSVINKNAD